MLAASWAGWGRLRRSRRDRPVSRLADRGASRWGRHGWRTRSQLRVARFDVLIQEGYENASFVVSTRRARILKQGKRYLDRCIDKWKLRTGLKPPPPLHPPRKKLFQQHNTILLLTILFLRGLLLRAHESVKPPCPRPNHQPAFTNFPCRDVRPSFLGSPVREQ